MNKRIEATISGRVQMVMYRDFVARTAKTLALCGFVRNCDNGTVSVIAEGEETLLTSLIEKLHAGSLFSKVENVSVVWLPATDEFTDFRIAYKDFFDRL